MNKQSTILTQAKQWSVMAAVMAFVCMPIQGFPQELPDGRTTVSFTEVAKQAIPAVVSVKVKTEVKSGSQSFGSGSNDPFDFFNRDDFFSQFFGRRPGASGQPHPRFQNGQGSGFIVSEDGYILTNGHVVNGAEEITVVLNDGKEYEAEVIGIDTNTDIAVIKINDRKLPYLSLGNSDDLEVGQWVMAIGNPLGLQASVTAGVVSAKGRNGLDLARIEDFIQTDAAINRGNSGGPLLNLNGEVIGMNTAIVTNMGSGGYMGIGFAIPSGMIRHIMDQLISNGTVTRGFIGVTLQQVDSNLAQSFGLEKIEGALISDVSHNSPAEDAGLKQGDVILSYDKKPVATIGALRNAISLMAPGSKITLEVLRNGRRIQVPISIGSFPEEEASASMKTNALGIEVQPLTPDIARNMGYIDLEGVVVGKVDPRSPAALVGIKQGTLIVAVNHVKITSIEDFNKQMAKADPKKPILLLVKQGDYMHFVSIKTG
jgi:serine protease Do